AARGATTGVLCAIVAVQAPSFRTCRRHHLLLIAKCSTLRFSVIIEVMQLNRPLTKGWTKWAAGLNVLAAACALYAADPAIITIQSKNLFPESITSTADGAIIIGSYGTSTIWRIPPG